MFKIIFLNIAVAFAFILPAKAQFLHSYGATIGITRATEVFNYDNSDLRQEMGYRTGFNGSLFLEFFNHNVFTWVMEAQFNQFGSRWLGTEGEEIFKNRLNYGSFNNSLKARAEGIDMNLYVLAGPRVKYLISSNSNDFPSPHVYSDFAFAVSGGLGMDLNFFEPVILFAEVQYIQGIFGSSDVPQYTQSKGLEIRIGIKKRI
ncbi:MAG: outer membrane beta-barrel protein, partial [Bacteroidetes bacterium]|nr:outer membrane beta-barrel protein [Bacteroidota bacterium]